jgi:hypothetical protein
MDHEALEGHPLLSRTTQRHKTQNQPLLVHEWRATWAHWVKSKARTEQGPQPKPAGAIAKDDGKHRQGLGMAADQA